MSGELFLTGATGYIGGSLLHTWLVQTDVRVNLLVRSRHGEDPRQRIEQAIAQLNPDPQVRCFSKRLNVIGGDVALARFGMGDAEYKRLANCVSHIIHCAAAARFDLELEDARRINVGGVQNILNCAGQCRDLRRIDYIGTAYVAGERTGIIREDELEAGQAHHNTYEQSKFEAEKLVRKFMVDLPITILRPSIVICDSETGRASSHNGFYRALRMYHLGLVKVLPGYPSSLLDLVPVDYVAAATCAIVSDEGSIGRCYHLTAGPGNATSFAEIRDLAGRYFGREKFALIPPEHFLASMAEMEETLTEDERSMMSEIRLYMPYMSGSLQFDNSNTIRQTGIEAPRVSTYFGKMAEYIMRQESV